MIDVTELMGTVFSGLSALVIEDVEDARDVICVRARTRDAAVACPGCGTETARVHEYRERTAADIPVDGRRVLARVRVRRMRCPVLDCRMQTFREQVPGVLDRYQRRISRLTAQVSVVARELAGRAQPRISGYLATTDTAADWGRSWLTVYQLLLPARAELIGACGRTCTPCQTDADRRDSCGGKNSSHSRQVADHSPYSQHRYGCATEPPRPFRYRRASCAAHQY